MEKLIDIVAINKDQGLAIDEAGTIYEFDSPFDLDGNEVDDHQDAVFALTRCDGGWSPVLFSGFDDPQELN